VRNGVSREVALEALTIAPAKLLGLDSQVGSLAVGKLANLQILTGDPLAATTWVDTLVLEGQVVYERSKDQRLQFLFGEEADKAKKAAGPDGKEPAKDGKPTPKAEEKPAEGKPENKPAEGKQGEKPAGEQGKQSGGDAPREVR
jgi:hypothetical protein